MRNDWDTEVPAEDEVKTVPIEDLDLGYGDPELDREVQLVDVQAAAAQDRYTLGLAQLRQAAGLTQVALAKQLGVAQPRISETEHGKDMLISTLSNYVRGLGYHLRLIVSDDQGRELAEVDPADLVEGRAS